MAFPAARSLGQADIAAMQYHGLRKEDPVFLRNYLA